MPPPAPPCAPHPAAQQRLTRSSRRARPSCRGPLADRGGAGHAWFDRAWIERSWRRCLAAASGPTSAWPSTCCPPRRRPRRRPATTWSAPPPGARALGRAIANTRYFAILTDARGVVMDVNGPIDRSDRRAQLITRIGVDLSERSVGTSAIGAVLAELQPRVAAPRRAFLQRHQRVQLRRRAAVRPRRRCVGMLDLTGIDTAERPELKHLVAQSARSIENALALARPHSLLLRLNWPGRRWATSRRPGLPGRRRLGDRRQPDRAANGVAAGRPAGAACIAASCLPCPGKLLFDCAAPRRPWRCRCGRACACQAWRRRLARNLPARRTAGRPDGCRSKTWKTELIRKAVQDARGNVMQAAQRLGISRATVYRKLGSTARLPC
jgi:transcriptional regulator of acetoin/glycerol metabolism